MINKNKNRLAVGLWVTPPPHLIQAADGIEREYGRIKDAGMNMVWGSWDYGEKLGDVLDACGRLGIDYIMPLPVDRTGNGDLEAEINKCLEVAEKYGGYCAVSGFNMIDEPSKAIFGRLKEIRERVDNAISEEKYTIANLFPGYAAPEQQLGAANYNDYVEAYMSAVKPKILSYDHYPLSLNPQRDNFKSFIGDLLEMRNASAKYNAPFWGFIQAIGYDGHREPSYGEMRWLINMHILFGAKGYSYFLYSAIGPTGGPENFTTSALAWDGSVTPLYEMIKSLNAEFAEFDRAFIEYRQDGFIPVNMENSLVSVFGNELITESYGRLKSIETDGVMLNGCFDYKGKKGIYLFNWDMNEPITASLVFSGESEYELWGKNGMEKSGSDECLIIALEAGEGKFLAFDLNSGRLP